ncbi:MAG: class I SAM-dependent methyltransferase [bacterium]|nr:class I SAM-dependent methyltransferase [bacterium]
MQTPISPNPSTGVTGTTHWGDVAEWYDAHVGDEGSEYHKEVILPGIMRLIEASAGQNEVAVKGKILDLACGQGVLCRKLAKEGFTVTGIDASSRLLGFARDRNEQDPLPIHYLMADATKLIDEKTGVLIEGLVSESYAAITIILAIQNISPLSPVWRACRELLVTHGRLILVMMHPCFRIPKESNWHWDDVTRSNSRVINQYLTSKKVDIETHPGQKARGEESPIVHHFHRPLQAYINTLGNAGMYIDHLEEWTSHKTDQEGPKKAAMDRSRKEIPLFMAIRARKI